jgi:hypothetical protein
MSLTPSVLVPSVGVLVKPLLAAWRRGGVVSILLLFVPSPSAVLHGLDDSDTSATASTIE